MTRIKQLPRGTTRRLDTHESGVQLFTAALVCRGMSTSRAQKRSGARRLQPVGYAKRLSPYTHKGVCGDEVEEEVEAVEDLKHKIDRLAEAVQHASYIVAHTGAGISTSAGIPDFRGKNGVWTKEKRGEALPNHETCWANAVPTLSHMALVGLLNAGRLQAIISQNIDGLHARSGIPRARLNELHGNMFLEKCQSCGHEITRSFDIGGVGFKPTGRTCPKSNCGCKMVDALLDWEDELPEPDFERSQEEAKRCRDQWVVGADGQVIRGGGLALCLGTSMQMVPASELPCEAGRMAIINLQPTQRDDEAWLVMRARLDDVMFRLMSRLKIPIPPYEREETVCINYEHVVRHSKQSAAGTCTIKTVLDLYVGESSSLQRVPSGYMASVVLTLQNQPLLTLQNQPFSHVEKLTRSMPCDSCPICKEDDSDTLSFTVEVHFEQILPCKAGSATITPGLPPLSRTIDLPAYRKKAGKVEAIVKLVRIDYSEVYVPSEDLDLDA